MGKILSEIVKDAKVVLNVAFDFTLYHVGTALTSAGIIPYAFPTFWIVGNENEKKLKQNSIEWNLTESIGENSGLITGLYLIYLQSNFYLENPKYLAIPAATNLVSAGVEYVKHLKKRSD